MKPSAMFELHTAPLICSSTQFLLNWRLCSRICEFLQLITQWLVFYFKFRHEFGLLFCLKNKKKTKQRWIMATALFIRNPSLSFWSFKLIYDMLSHSHFKWVGVNDIQKKLTALRNANHSYKSTQFTHITY